MAAEHAKAFASLAHVRLVSVAGEIPERAHSFAKRFGIPTSGTDVAALVAATNPDVIVAAVSLPAIPYVYRDLLASDATLLLEKPFGLDFAQASDLYELTQHRAYGTYVAMNRRAYANLRAARDATKSDPGPLLVQVSDEQSFSHPRSKGYPDSVVKRWMYANAIHLVDLLVFFGRGAVTSVESSGWDSIDDQPRLVNARVEFESGDIATYEALWSVQGPWSVTVTSQNTRWEMRPLEAARWRSAHEADWSNLAPDPRDLEFKPGLFHQAMQVTRAANGMACDLVTPDTAMESIRVLSEIYRGR